MAEDSALDCTELEPSSRTTRPGRRVPAGVRQPAEILSTASLQVVQLGHRFIQVGALALECAAPFLDVLDQEAQLPGFTWGLVVHVDDLGDLVQGEAEPLPAQYQLQPHPVPVG